MIRLHLGLEMSRTSYGIAASNLVARCHAGKVCCTGYHTCLAKFLYKSVLFPPSLLQPGVKVLAITERYVLDGKTAPMEADGEISTAVYIKSFQGVNVLSVFAGPINVIKWISTSIAKETILRNAIVDQCAIVNPFDRSVELLYAVLKTRRTRK